MRPPVLGTTLMLRTFPPVSYRSRNFFSEMTLRLSLLLFLLRPGFALAYEPPAGIPMPSFGIKESHTMYVGQEYAYSTGTAPYKDAGNGPYTHYIDNTSSSATDTDNPYGTPALPRVSIPKGAPAGSVIEIHGGPYGTG